MSERIRREVGTCVLKMELVRQLGLVHCRQMTGWLVILIPPSLCLPSISLPLFDLIAVGACVSAGIKFATQKAAGVFDGGF